MLTIIIGMMGSGKTLLLTLIAKVSVRPVIANYELKQIPFSKFDFNKFAECQYEDCTLLIDEAYLLLDSRNSMSNQNKVASYVLFQSRKKDIDLFIAVQLGSALDIRYRQLADFIVFAEKIPTGFRYAIATQKCHLPAFLYLSLEKASEIFPFFNTMELVNPNGNKTENIETARVLASEICTEFPTQTITKAIFGNWMYEHSVNPLLKDLIYGYIKEIEGKKKGMKKK